MIEAWFNERGYFVEGSKGDSKFVYDLPENIVNNASMLYTTRWLVLNQMLDTISLIGEQTRIEDLVLYTDSRLIEELQGELTPDNSFAKDSLRYFIESDYRTFRRVIFRKCAATTINGKLSEQIDTARHQ